MVSIAKTHIGLVRGSNQDYYLEVPPHLYVIADGMGGHSAGEVASKAAVEYIKENFDIEQVVLESDILNYLADITQAVNTHVFNMAQENEAFNSMGTTLIIVYVFDGVLYFAHVGDSRLYIHRGNQLQQITQDHSFVAEMLKNGYITTQEAQTHPKKNLIMRAVGASETLQVDTGKVLLQEQDLILLCTDGLTNMISDDYLQEILNTKDSLQEVADILLEEANAAGGKDNITFILYKNI